MTEQNRFSVAPATADDLTQIIEIYERGRAYQASHGNPNQWRGGYPDPETVACDLEAQRLYVLRAPGETGRAILAVFVYAVETDEAYRQIDGAWLNDEPYGYVHRICSAMTVRGAGRYCVDWAYRQCGNLRIDTHRDNASMQHVLSSLGFTLCGTVRVRDGSERLAYQKTANQPPPCHHAG